MNRAPMNRTKTALFAIAAASVVAAAGYSIAQTPPAAPAAAPVPATAADLKPGAYTSDPSHTKVTWFILHNSFSTYSGIFPDVAANLTIGATPQQSTLSVTIPLTKVITGSTGLDGHLNRADFFDTAKWATATFKSTSVTVTGANTGRVTGDLTIKDVTKPVTLDVTFVKGAPGRGGGQQLGFDARGVIKRSDFGITYGLPASGDNVEIRIGAEFRAAPPAA